MVRMKNESGMGVVEVLRILVVVGILGFTGWFVWQSQKNTADSLNDANKSQTPTQVTKTDTKDTTSSADSTDASTKYLVIKEWGVQFPYVASATNLSYTIENDIVSVISSSLANMYPGCELYGAGVISRATGDTELGPGAPGDTYASLYAKVKDTSSPVVSKLGDYYYLYSSNQVSCSTNPTQQAIDDQSEASAFVRAIIQNVE